MFFGFFTIITLYENINSLQVTFVVYAFLLNGIYTNQSIHNNLIISKFFLCQFFIVYNSLKIMWVVAHILGKSMKIDSSKKIERMQKAKEQLLASLKKEYDDIPLTALESLAKEIKVIPSVRSGNIEKRDTSDYYELSPIHLNKYNELLIQERELGLANSRVVEKYALQYGDLLVSYRGFREIAVGRFAAKECDKPAVGAVSNFRIRFKPEESEPLSLAVLSFLTSSLAQRYLRTRLDSLEPISSPNKKRYTLSKEFLCAMPIPDFRSITKEYPLDSLYYRYREKLALTKELSLMMQSLYHQTDDDNDALIATYLQKNEQLPEIATQEATQIKQLEMLQKQIEMFLDKEKFEAFKQKMAHLPFLR